jgi:hypothetical protein
LFDLITTTSNVLKLIKYTVYVTYVLVPYVTYILIANDLGCPSKEAYQIILKSRDTGAKIHYKEDEELKDILSLNTQLACKEKVAKV